MVYCVNSLRTGCSLCPLYAHSGLWCQVLRDIDGMTDRLLALWWHLSLICFFSRLQMRGVGEEGSGADDYEEINQEGQ